MSRKLKGADVVLVTDKQEVPLSEGDWVMKYQISDDEIQIRKCRADLFWNLYAEAK
jgi:hypothetical protein